MLGCANFFNLVQGAPVFSEPGQQVALEEPGEGLGSVFLLIRKESTGSLQLGDRMRVLQGKKG